jgi:uncharacterized membrane protein YraQ (UPF0718 family)/YHS domain-containing protein
VVDVFGVTAGGFAVDVGRSLREALYMFWETLWPLVLGFALAGAVQAFASREQMERVLGDHRAVGVVRASAFGMVSSSCSYAASAMAKSLVQKGADFVSAMVFMFASTNLVIELGIVLVVLLGWQFAAAQFVGGFIMIALLAIIGGFVLRAEVVEPARRRLAQAAEPIGGTGSTVNAGVGRPWASRAAWTDAARYAIGDLTMLRRELIIGYAVAGFLTVLVPSAAWNALFIHGHGVWTLIENAAVAPVIAFSSFVCSIGNVPMAAALWKGGISFGGVISFIFADLVAAPLVLVYRRYYGWRLTLRLVGLFWAIMALAGLVVGAIFSGSGLVPHERSLQVVSTAIHFDATAVLDAASVGVLALLFWLHRTREDGAGSAVVRDPVCGMRVRAGDAPARSQYMGHSYRFCSDRCAQAFGEDPARYVDAVTAPHGG